MPGAIRLDLLDPGQPAYFPTGDRSHRTGGKKPGGTDASPGIPLAPAAGGKRIARRRMDTKGLSAVYVRKRGGPAEGMFLLGLVLYA